MPTTIVIIVGNDSVTQTEASQKILTQERGNIIVAPAGKMQLLCRLALVDLRGWVERVFHPVVVDSASRRRYPCWLQ